MTEESGYDLEQEAGIANENDDERAETAATIHEAAMSIKQWEQGEEQRREDAMRMTALDHANQNRSRQAIMSNPADIVADAAIFLAFLKGERK